MAQSQKQPLFDDRKDIQTKVELLISNKKKPEKKFNNNPPKKEVPRANLLLEQEGGKGRNEYMHTSVINESIEVSSSANLGFQLKGLAGPHNRLSS